MDNKRFRLALIISVPLAALVGAGVMMALTSPRAPLDAREQETPPPIAPPDSTGPVRLPVPPQVPMLTRAQPNFQPPRRFGRVNMQTWQRDVARIQQENNNLRRENEIDRAKLAVEMYHLDVSDADIRAALDDSPAAAGYAAYAERDGMRVYTVKDSDYNGQPDMKIGCFAIRSPEQNRTLHWVVKHDDSHLGDRGMTELWEWLSSGCAESVRTNGQTLSPPQVNVTLIKLLPTNGDFEQQRRVLQASMNTPPVRQRNNRWWRQIRWP